MQTGRTQSGRRTYRCAAQRGHLSVAAAGRRLRDRSRPGSPAPAGRGRAARRRRRPRRANREDVSGRGADRFPGTTGFRPTRFPVDQITDLVRRHPGATHRELT